MRMRLLLPAAAAILLLADQYVLAQSPTGVGCVDHPFNFVEGITNVEAHTRVGRPCQIGFGRGSNIAVLQIAVRPAHGTLGASGKEGNRRYVAYVPQRGFAGHDRFEVYLRYDNNVVTRSTLVKVEMTITP